MKEALCKGFSAKFMPMPLRPQGMKIDLSMCQRLAAERMLAHGEGRFIRSSLLHEYGDRRLGQTGISQAAAETPCGQSRAQPELVESNISDYQPMSQNLMSQDSENLVVSSRVAAPPSMATGAGARPEK